MEQPKTHIAPISGRSTRPSLVCYGDRWRRCMKHSLLLVATPRGELRMKISDGTTSGEASTSSLLRVTSTIWTQ